MLVHDPLQAWLVLCEVFDIMKFQQVAKKLKPAYAQILVEAVDILDQHHDARMTGEDDTDIIVVASDCQEPEWYAQLDFLIGEISILKNAMKEFENDEKNV